MTDMLINEKLTSENTRDVIEALSKVNSFIANDAILENNIDEIFNFLISLLIHTHVKIRIQTHDIMQEMIEKYTDLLPNIENCLPNLLSSLYQTNKHISNASLKSITIILTRIEPLRYWKIIKEIIFQGKTLQIREQILEILATVAKKIPLCPIFQLLDDPNYQIRNLAIKILKNADPEKVIASYEKVVVSYEATQLLNQNIKIHLSKIPNESSKSSSKSLSIIPTKSVSITQDSFSLFKSSSSLINQDSKNILDRKTKGSNLAETPHNSKIETIPEEIINSTSKSSIKSAQKSKTKPSPRQSKSNASIKSDKNSQNSGILLQTEKRIPRELPKTPESDKPKQEKNKSDYGYYSHWYYSDYTYSSISEPKKSDNANKMQISSHSQPNKPVSQENPDHQKVNPKELDKSLSSVNESHKDKSKSKQSLKGSPLSKASSKFDNDTNEKSPAIDSISSPDKIPIPQKKILVPKAEKVIEDLTDSLSPSFKDDSEKLAKSDESVLKQHTSIQAVRNPGSTFSDFRHKFSFANQKTRFSTESTDMRRPLANIPVSVIRKASWLEKLTYLEQISHAITNNQPFNVEKVIEIVLASCEIYHIRVAQFVTGLLHDLILRYPEILQSHIKEIVMLMLNLSNVSESDALFDALVIESNQEDLISNAIDAGESSSKSLPVEQFCLAVLTSPYCTNNLTFSTISRLVMKSFAKTNDNCCIVLAREISMRYTQHVQKIGSSQGAAFKKFFAPFIRESLKLQQSDKNKVDYDYSVVIEAFKSTDDTQKSELLKTFINHVESLSESQYSASENKIMEVAANIKDAHLLDSIFTGKTDEIKKQIPGLSKFVCYCSSEFLRDANKYYQTLYSIFKTGNSKTRIEIVKILCMIENCSGRSILDEENIPETHRLLIGEMMGQYF